MATECTHDKGCPYYEHVIDNAIAKLQEVMDIAIISDNRFVNRDDFYVEKESRDYNAYQMIKNVSDMLFFVRKHVK